MESSQTPIFLVLGLIYACGAGLELLLRLSEGVPLYSRSVFQRNFTLAVTVCFVLPIIFWPFVGIWRILGPPYQAILECFRDEVDTVTSDDMDSMASEEPTDASHDMEKGYAAQDKAS